MNNSITAAVLIASSAAVFAFAPAGGNNDLPHVFESGTPARAAEVNENFQSLLTRIQELELQIETLVDKTQFMTVVQEDLNGMAGPHMVIEGANVHVRSGSGATDDGGTPTGLGNLVIGYNEIGSLSPADRIGAHNFVMGKRNAYTKIAGIVAGADNRIDGTFAAIIAGRHGRVSGEFSSITGGGGETPNLFNEVIGEYASINGGFRNMASGDQSAISGGSNNEATGFLTSILGGTSNVASGAGAAVSGGAGNEATGANAAISGGQNGQAGGVSSSVTGGLSRSVTQNFDCADCN
ncbi:MAG: hypothetical protein ACI8QC_000242 [Planctomycetota bacterium]|jgi:hypothetical protein